MAALLAEEEGTARADQEAEEKKRLKRQRQKEKQRAAKEAAEAEEKAKREAAEAEERKKAQEEEEEREKVEAAEKEAAVRALEEAKKLQGIDAQLASEQGAEGVGAQTEDVGDKSGPSEGFGNIDGGVSSSEPPAAPKSAKKAAKKKKKKKAKEDAEEGSRPGSEDAAGVPNSPSTEAAIDTSPGGVGTPEVREVESISASIVSDAMLFGDLGISENYGAEEPHDEVAGSLSKSVEGTSIADVEVALANEDSVGGNADLAALMETPELYAATGSMPLETSKNEISAAPPSETNDWKQLLSFLLPDAEINDSQATPAIEEEEHESLAAQDHGHDRAFDDFPDKGVSTRSAAGGVLVPPPSLRPRALPPHTLLAVCIAQPTRWARLEATLRCPYSEAPLYDPVILPDGITYDRTAAKSLGQMEVRGARPNRSMQQLLRELCGA